MTENGQKKTNSDAEDSADVKLSGMALYLQDNLVRTVSEAALIAWKQGASLVPSDLESIDLLHYV